MLFQKKVDRAMKYSKEHAANQHPEYDPKSEPEERPLKEEMEKGDLPAMMISVAIVIIPVSLVLLLIIGLLGMLPLFS